MKKPAVIFKQWPVKCIYSNISHKSVCIVYAYILLSSGCGISQRTLIIFSLQRFPEESTSTFTVFWRCMYSYRESKCIFLRHKNTYTNYTNQIW